MVTYLVVVLIVLFAVSTWHAARGPKASGLWDSGRPGFNQAQVFLDGVYQPLCVRAHTGEQWVEVHRYAAPKVIEARLRASLAGGAAYPAVSPLLEVDETGRLRVFRVYGKVEVSQIS